MLKSRRPAVITKERSDAVHGGSGSHDQPGKYEETIRETQLKQLIHLAWQKRVRFSHLHVPRGASIRLPKKNFSVTSFENLLKALQHLFVIFFDDMIEQKKVTQGSHVRLLCYGVLWTVFEEKAYFMS